jgi:hypothetical protein
MIKQLLLIGTVAISSFATAQSLTNGNFEAWTVNGTYEEPDGWVTLNIYSFVTGGQIPVTKTTDAHGGLYAARVETITTDLEGDGSADTIPGIIYCGVLQLGSEDEGLGIPFAARPDSLTGWYKYAPVAGDTCLIDVTLSKWNGTSRDIIGTGTFSSSAAVADFTRISVPIEYASSITPDTMAFVVLGSAGDLPIPGTAIWVDDFSFITNSTASVIPKAPEAPIRVYPNPARDVLNVVLAEDATIHIYNALGKEVDALKGNGSKTVTIATSGYDNGVYLLKTDTGIVQRFVVKH